jgi:chromosome segregation protein
MYLKRLDVQGFKSFASKTTLEFHPGVTCIIGPNGTGKTNVADALRWVLGEHASRTLRARKTEDVIFAGSDKRAAMGVAEVSITLDNSEQWLPIDFDEVVVSRRAYRSGDNEYLINNARVRLRDVIDLFMRAQVGQNSYAFMGQGMVEQVLSLRPEDRRALIEEAADVRLYRHKLEDARNKLKGTRENLDRVYMLVREIEPRITQLERQAGRAARWKELTQELAATLHVWYSHQWQEVNAALLAAIATHDQAREECEQLQGTTRQYEEGLVQLRAAIEERRNEIRVREGRLQNMQEYARDLERRVGLDAERERLLRERIEELSAELVQLDDDLRAQAAASTIPDTAELEARLEEARTTLLHARGELATVDAELSQAQADARAADQDGIRARAQLDVLRRETEANAESMRRARHERDVATAERKATVVELATWAREHATAATETTDLAPRIDAVSHEVDELEQASGRYRAEREALDAELARIRAEAEALAVKAETLEALDVRPQAPDAGVRAILEAGGVLSRDHVPNDLELQGVIGLVGQLVRVPPGLERAIEAALAENLFAVVFARDIDMRRAVQMLLEGDAGRATMYALDSFQESRPLRLIKERGIVGVASQLVRCESRYRKLIDTLLGRTVVVENINVAQRVVRRGLAGAVATLDGVLVRPVGSMAAGAVAAIEAAFVRERELGDLPEELTRLRTAVAERETRIADLTRLMDDTDARADDARGRLTVLRERQARAEMAMTSARDRLAAFRAQLRALDAQIAAHQRSLAGRGDAIERERIALESDAADAERRAAAAAESVATLGARRTALVGTVDETSAVVAQLDGQHRAERATTSGERAAVERLQRQIAQKDEQRGRLQREAHEIGTRLEATRRELNERTAEVEAIQQELEPARSELAQLESRERELTAALAESNAQMHQSERVVLEAENTVRVRTEELQTLRQSLEAEGFVATDGGEIERAPEPEPEPEFEPAEAYEGDGHAGGAPPSWLRSDGDGGLPPVRGGSTINPTEVRDRIAELRAQIRSLGPVNEQAASDYADSRERYDFLSGQLNDLRQADEQLNEAINELEGVIRERFRTTFRTVNQEFERYFSAFFRGGTARLELGETDEDGLPGIEIVAQPPGKKLGSLALLSGGERSLTAVALLFALLQANPSPMCVLDEVDAALDEANVGRFVEELRELAQRTQFIIITHNRRTIENADTIYGVSMGADNVSRVLSLRLADVPKDLDR